MVKERDDAGWYPEAGHVARVMATVVAQAEDVVLGSVRGGVGLGMLWSWCAIVTSNTKSNAVADEDGLTTLGALNGHLTQALMTILELAVVVNRQCRHCAATVGMHVVTFVGRVSAFSHDLDREHLVQPDQDRVAHHSSSNLTLSKAGEGVKFQL